MKSESSLIQERDTVSTEKLDALQCTFCVPHSSLFLKRSKKQDTEEKKTSSVNLWIDKVVFESDALYLSAYESPN